jgi:transcriptional regulator with XRE-family HTH domain
MSNHKLQTARKERHWTIAQVAEAVGVSELTYSRWENGKQEPHSYNLKKLCKLYKKSPEDLGIGLEKLTPSTIASATQVTNHTQKAFGLVSSSVDMFKIAISALMVARYQYEWTIDELCFKAEQEMRIFDAMATQQNGERFSRRQALGILAGLPIAFLGLSRTDNTLSLPTEGVISLYVNGIPACWGLYFDGELSEVAGVIPEYVSHLTLLVQHPSKYQQTAACLLSQAHQLGYLLELQGQNFKTAQIHANQALEYAELTNDPNLRVASLIRQGNLLHTLKRPTQTVEKYREAIQYSSSASPLLQGQAYIGLSEALAKLYEIHSQEALKQEALRYHGLAYEVFPTNPKEDPNYAYTHFKIFTITNFEGLMHIHLGQPQQAWEAFAQVDKEIPQALVPQRVELMNRQTATFLALGDMHQTCDHVELAVPAALALGSDLRYNETCEIYEQAQTKWPHEQRVKNLGELFRI